MYGFQNPLCPTSNCFTVCHLIDCWSPAKKWKYKPKDTFKIIPIGPMYGKFTYIWVIFRVNVVKYSIHGSYGIEDLRILWDFLSIHSSPVRNSSHASMASTEVPKMRMPHLHGTRKRRSWISGKKPEKSDWRGEMRDLSSGYFTHTHTYIIYIYNIQ